MLYGCQIGGNEGKNRRQKGIFFRGGKNSLLFGIVIMW